MDEDKVLAAIAALGQELRGEVARVEARIGALQAPQDAFRGAVMGKFEQVRDELTVIREDVGVVMLTASRAVRRTEQDRDEMRGLGDQVAKMFTSMLRMRTDIEELQRRA